MTGPIKRALLATLLLMAFVAPGGVAYALWSTTSTATVSVSIAAPTSSSPTVPASPVASCATPSTATINWTPVSGATYQVYKSGSVAGTYQIDNGFSSPSATTHTPSLTGQETSFFRVVAVVGSTPSAFSNTLRIVRSGNSYTCTSVTP